jgi:hypothetical protein
MASTRIDDEKWPDGVPYDLEALTSLQADERRSLALAPGKVRQGLARPGRAPCPGHSSSP